MNKKQALLDRLKDRLASRRRNGRSEAELEQFEAQYTMEVGRLYAELDEIEAEIAEEEVRIHPDDDEIPPQSRRSSPPAQKNRPLRPRTKIGKAARFAGSRRSKPKRHITDLPGLSIPISLLTTDERDTAPRSDGKAE